MKVTKSGFAAQTGWLILTASLGLIGILSGQQDLLAQSDVSFPQIIVGQQFETVIQIANQVGVADTITLEVFSGNEGTNGMPLEVEFDSGTPVSSKTVSLIPFQEQSILLSLRDSELEVGWLRLRSSAPGGKVAASLFYRITSAGQVLDSVGVTDSKRYRFAQIQFDDRAEAAQTGIAFINPDDSDVECTVDLFQGDAHRGRFSQTLGPREHFARLISEIFPGFQNLNGSLIVETSAGRAIPILTLRIDGQQLTSLPVRPLGFTLQYEIRGDTGDLQESGYWILDSEGFNVVGSGWTAGEESQGSSPVLGTWVGKRFQCFRKAVFVDGSVGSMVFNGTSAGDERTNGEPIVGKVSLIGSDGQVQSIRDFIAFNKY